MTRLLLFLIAARSRDGHLLRLACSLLVVLINTFCPQPVDAITRTWTGGANGLGTSWSNANFWNPAGTVPQAGDDVVIPTVNAVDTNVTYDYTGAAVTLNSLTLNRNNNVFNNFASILTMSANTLSANFEYLGDSSAGGSRGRGRIDQSGGTNDVSSTAEAKLILGRLASNSGVYNLSGLAYLYTTELHIGEAGSGFFNQTGGTNSSGKIVLGTSAGSSGTYTFSGGSITGISGIVDGLYGNGTMNQSAGMANLSKGLAVGAGTGSSGAYILSGGSLSVDSDVEVGGSGTGTFTHSDGIHTINNTNAGGELLMGTLDSGTGNYTLSGSGSLTVTGQEFIGIQGTGTITQNGGSHTVYPYHDHDGMSLGETSGTGTYNLNGGTLTAPYIYIGGSLNFSGGTGTFNFNSPATLNVGGYIKIWFNGTLAGNGTTSASVINDGTISPGSSPGTLTIGALTENAVSKLQIELAGTTPGAEYDQLHVSGAATLGGTLQVSLTNDFTPAAGNSFDILDWGALSGTFTTLTLPALSSGFAWNTSQLYVNGTLSVTIAGDYNGNGVVDAADYVVWRKGLGTIYTQADYEVWRSHFGQTAGSGSGVSSRSANIPEPASVMLLLIAATLAASLQTRISPRCPQSDRRRRLRLSA